MIRHESKLYPQKKVKDSSGTERTETTTETITATTDGDNLNLVTEKADTNGKKFGRAQFSGKRIKPMPPQPDLNKVKFGDPVQILNGKDLGGWRLINPKDKNGWKVENGVLSNRVVKGEHYGNIRTGAITLVDRHLTVILNGKTIIDNQPVLGCTGGALTSDEFKPGPIYLQGDHTDIDFRNIVLRPVVK